MLGTRAAVSREEISNAAVFAAITVFTLSQIVTSTSQADLYLLVTPASKSPWRLQYLAPAEIIPGKAMSKCFAMASTFSTESVVYHGPSTIMVVYFHESRHRH